MTTRPLVLATCLVLCSFAPSSSAAQASATSSSDGSELEAEARARFALGQLYYSQARFAEAATEFEAAYALHAHPLLLHNIYLSRRDMGDFPGALDALTRYLETATDLSASDRRVLEGRQAAMRRQIEEATPSAPPPVEEPTVDAVVGDATPPGMDETLGDPVLPPTAPAPPPADDGLMIGAIVSFSVAGAAAITMLITGPLALTERDHLASTCAPTCSDEQISTAQTLGVVTDVALTVGAIAAATGAVLAIVASTRGSGVSVTPSVSPDHAAIVVGGQF
jgi:hypothetical protein